MSKQDNREQRRKGKEDGVEDCVQEPIPNFKIDLNWESGFLSSLYDCC